MTEIFQNNSAKKPSRPDGLSVLCILSFIGSGFSFFSSIMVFWLYPTFLEIVGSDEFAQFPSLDSNMLLDFLQSAGKIYFLISAILYLISVTGVYFMWKLKKKGIHFYAIAQISLVILPLIFISTNLSVLPNLIIVGAFIFMYSRHLKIMHD
jgi:hypothetical protein